MQLNLIIDNLKKKGFKDTPLRKKLIDIFLTNNTPLSVPEILKILENENLGVNKTTVYREINFLLSQKLIIQVDLRERGKRYEFDLKTHHHHLICIKCNQIEDFDLENDLDAIEIKIKEVKSFNVLNHSLEFYGICQKCNLNINYKNAS